MDNYKIAVTKAIELGATISVGDSSVDYFDLEKSVSLKAIVAECEGTDDPYLVFYLDGESQGAMSVIVGYGEESICDYHCSDFIEKIVEDCY